MDDAIKDFFIKYYPLYTDDKFIELFYEHFGIKLGKYKLKKYLDEIKDNGNDLTKYPVLLRRAIHKKNNLPDDDVKDFGVIYAVSRKDLLNKCLTIKKSLKKLYGIIPDKPYLNYKYMGQWNPAATNVLIKLGILENYKNCKQSRKNYRVDVKKLNKLIRYLRSMKGERVFVEKLINKLIYQY